LDQTLLYSQVLIFIANLHRRDKCGHTI